MKERKFTAGRACCRRCVWAAGTLLFVTISLRAMPSRHKPHRGPSNSRTAAAGGGRLQGGSKGLRRHLGCGAPFSHALPSHRRARCACFILAPPAARPLPTAGANRAGAGRAAEQPVHGGRCRAARCDRCLHLRPAAVGRGAAAVGGKIRKIPSFLENGSLFFPITILFLHCPHGDI